MEGLSLRQAIGISKASQFMVGLPFDSYRPDPTPILCVTVCPHNEVLKDKFLQDYETFGLTDLTEYIEEDEFDVIVIARSPQDEEACLFMDIRNCMENKEMKLVA
jgi:hypothetical protein